ncbi:hypothetical protein GCM10017161_06410 [Thalassotalea marina]|uniref:histidine kinase n=2 Tax=Thalassotalea marina TaxID=1673741 RepID=A0A919BDP2_9GAMM|nr:hypothetical protein GCM10017161_06410 [Thalassotalea marina]
MAENNAIPLTERFNTPAISLIANSIGNRNIAPTITLENASFYSGVFFGLMAILSLLNLFFSLILRMRSHLYLSLALYNTAIAYGLYNGTAVAWVPSALVNNVILIFIIHVAFAFIALYLFCSAFLTKQNSLFSNAMKYTAIAFWALTFLLQASDSIHLSLTFAAIGAFTFTALCLFWSVQALQRHKSQAILLIAGLSFLLIGLLIELNENLLILSTTLPDVFNIQNSILLMALLLTSSAIIRIKEQQLSSLNKRKIDQQADQQFSQIFEQSHQMQFILATDQKVLAVNQAVEQFTQKKRQQIINNPFCNSFATLRENLDKEQLEEKFNQALTGEQTELDVVAFTGQSLLRDLEIVFQPILNDSGDVVNIMVRVHDITQQTQAFNAIQDIVVGVASLSTDNFFKHLVHEVSRIYKTKYVLISLLNETKPATATTIVLSENKIVIPNITYAIKDTPSEQLLSKHICHYNDDMEHLFPNDNWIKINKIRSYIGVNIKDIEGNVIGFLSVLDDKPMTEESYFIEVLDIFASRIASEIRQQSAQNELKLALDRLDFHITNTPLGVIEWDANFEIINWNKAAEAIFGFKQSDFVGKDPITVLVPEESIPEIMRLTEELVTKQASQYNLNKNLTKSGHNILCEWYNTPLLDEDNNVIGIASLVNDVTAEHEALNALYQKENEQREVFNSLLDAIFILGANGEILIVNNAASSLFDHPSEKLIGSAFVQLLVDEDKNWLQEFIQKVSIDGMLEHPAVEKESLMINRVGDTIPIHLSITYLKASSSSSQRFVCTCRDLTIFKQQQETIKQTQKMEALGNLTGGIAHDFNNLLGIINGYGELLSSNLTENDKLNKYAQQIRKASARGAKLTQKLLSFARKNTIESKVVNINEILTDEFEMLQKTITPRIDLTYQLDDALPATKLDKEEFEDCVLNLSINAMHAIEKQGEITISTQLRPLDTHSSESIKLPPGNYIAVAIKDTGKGMDKQTLQRATDPFFSTKGESGTGLGLSQVYGFVERSNGRLLIESEVNKGTTVTMIFPVTTEQVSEPIKGKKISLQSDLQGKVLVVDDEPALAELAKTMLETAGYIVEAVHSAADALQAIDVYDFDLVVCDIIMPNMDGVTLAHQVKQKHPELPFLFVSGYHEYNAEQIQALSAPVVNKPYTNEELIEHVSQLTIKLGQSALS